MSKFLKVPVSPLMGSTLFNYYKIIISNKVDIKYVPHVIITLLIVILITPFQLLDKIIFILKKKKKFSDPIFIIGHWRSGTTLLHNILCKNNKFGFINTYNSLFINNIYSSFLFKTLMKYTMPKERPSDKIKLDVELPQEDEFSVSNYTNISHYLFFFFPNQYKKFYSEAIRFEKNNEKLWLSKYSEILDRIFFYTGKSKILIKNPSNTARIKSLLKKYPTAKFIHIYRNPIFVYLSTLKFFSELFPSVNLQNIDNETLKKLIIYNYKEIYKDFYDHKNLIPKGNLIELKFEDFRKNPSLYLKDVYKMIGIDFKKEDLNQLRLFLDNQKKHKMNKYKIDKNTLEIICNEFKFSLKKMKYNIPSNIKVIN